MSRSFLLSQANRFRGKLALIAGAGLLSAIAALSLPWLAGQMLGGLIQDSAFNVYTIAGLLILALAATTTFNIIAGLISARTSGEILADLRKQTYSHVQFLPVTFHDQSNRGDLLVLMTHDLRSLSSFLSSTLAGIPSMLLIAIGGTILLLVIDPAMALVIPGLLPVYFIVTRLVGRRLRGLAAAVREADAKVIWTAEADLEMLPATKAFGTEARLADEYSTIVERARKLAFKQDQITTFVGPVLAFLAALIAVSVIVFLSVDDSAASRRPGDLFATLLYAALLTRPIGGLAGVYGQWQIARGTIARLEQVLENPIEPGHNSSGGRERAKGALQFDGVSFGYDDRDAVLRKADFAIEPGEVVALVGENGAGKTTIARLMLRFYEPQNGRILLDGADVSDLQIQNLRRQFGYVPQRALLYNGTIAHNVAFGRSDASPEDIESALRIAQGWQFVSALPDGLDTRIGDNGVRLSGGQQQRIALARALLIDPPILVLDEATSMYDNDSEAAFVAECQHAFEGRTVILITHRGTTLSLADRILETRDGGVFER